MHLTFCGASHEVTGSNFLLEIEGKRLLIDCGMFQGRDFADKKNEDMFLYEPTSIDAVLVTHPHNDHIGRIPKLIAEGFAGPVYMTKGACELAALIWEDAYKIMKYEADKFGRKMLYEQEDYERAEQLCRGVDYGESLDLGGGVSAVWKDAGHIFGAAFIEVSGEGRKIAFSGDIGNENVPILKDTEPLSADVDVLLCESTYGDRVHEDVETGREILLRLITEAAKRGGTIMMPAFSLERTQEILYRLHTLREHDKTLPNLPIYLDSPLAIRALDTYRRYPEYYDKAALEMYKKGDDFLDFPDLTLTLTQDDSKTINNAPSPKMIIAGSGMMNGGRILHHAMRYLPDPRSTLIIVGYQAHGTLGRKLYEGATNVRIFHQDVPVRATIKAIGVLSAHGDQKKLLNWVGSGGTAPKTVFCVHGESHAATELAHRIRDTYPGTQAFVPELGERVAL